MVANLRSKSIEGHVSDSAGNILRNATVIIKQPTPNGAYIVDTIQSDDDGYFVSKPAPNGIYDIYESGIKISRIIHSPDSGKIQCFKANKENYDTSEISLFNDLVNSKKLNNFYGFIQLESQLIDIYQYGNTFPIYDQNLVPYYVNDPYFELPYIREFFNLSADSRLTISRFDIEYFAPITIFSNFYKRIRWAGVPAIRFYKDSRLVIPLDYYSIVANNPKYISPATGPIDMSIIITITDSNNITISELSPGYIVELSNHASIGDILKLIIQNDSEYIEWYGIINNISEGTANKSMGLEKWRSSRFISGNIGSSPTPKIFRIYAYDGMFSNIMDINEDVNQRFSVFENISVQNNATELYNYSNTVS